MGKVAPSGETIFLSFPSVGEKFLVRGEKVFSGKSGNVGKNKQSSANTVYGSVPEKN